MSDKIIHLEFYRKKKLAEMIDPCSVCTDKTNCTCEEARIWWDKFVEKLNRQKIINLLGGE